MKEELKIDNEQVKFKLKVINTRILAYPHLSVTKSDLFGWEVGDIITQNNNTIYKIVSITRNSITDIEIKEYMRRMDRYRSTDIYPRFKNLLEEYKEVGNFGICSIHIKCILRGDKEVLKGKIITLLEFDQLMHINYRYYSKTDLDSIITNKDYYINRLQFSINRGQAKLDKQKRIKSALNSLKSKIIPSTEENTVAA